MDFSVTKMANASIHPGVAVMHDVTKDFRVIEGTAGVGTEGSINIGIAHDSERKDPSNSDGLAAIVGENLKIYGDGAKDIRARLGGTVVRGDRLKSTTAGKLIVVAANKDNIVAIANQSGILDDLISVDVVIGIYNV